MPVWSARDLLHLNRRQLIGFMKDGHPIEPSELENFEYRGVSLGLPELVERLTWKKFKKVFHRDRATGLLRGWNVRLDQNGLDGPWVPLTRNEVPVTFGHFRVVSGAGYRMPEPCAQGLVLDYGLGGNRRREGLSLVRDPDRGGERRQRRAPAGVDLPRPAVRAGGHAELLHTRARLPSDPRSPAAAPAAGPLIDPAGRLAPRGLRAVTRALAEKMPLPACWTCTVKPCSTRSAVISSMGQECTPPPRFQPMRTANRSMRSARLPFLAVESSSRMTSSPPGARARAQRESHSRCSAGAM